jgi:hypothetical protein
LLTFAKGSALVQIKSSYFRVSIAISSVLAYLSTTTMANAETHYGFNLRDAFSFFPYIVSVAVGSSHNPSIIGLWLGFFLQFFIPIYLFLRLLFKEKSSQLGR